MATYNRLNPEDTAVSTDKVVSNTWSNDVNILTTQIFTASVQSTIATATSQGNFFIEVYTSSSKQDPALDKPFQGEGNPEFTVSYGNKTGLGAENFTNTAGALGNTATKCIYRQYAQLVFGDENSNFVFNGQEPNGIYVVNISRARYKHGLKAGSLNLTLNDGGGGGDYILTDDSITLTGSAVVTNLGRQFNLVEGTDGVMTGTNLSQTPGNDKGSYGFVYPEAGVIIFNEDALVDKDPASHFVVPTTSTNESINLKLVGAIQRGASFELDSEERVSSQYMFVRVKNSEYNYSSNPSYIDTNGNLNNTTMVDSPTTYVTTVGLYNDDNNLLAVAKLSQPLKKDFTTEALVRVKLDY